MNELLALLAGGDLRSDGRGNEVADEVIRNPDLFELLVEGLEQDDDVVRGRTAHALERVSRHRPELLAPHFDQMVVMSREDDLPMVRWHLAMILGNMAAFPTFTDAAVDALFALLVDESVFVKSWAISGLCIIGRGYPARRGEIIAKIVPLRSDSSIAVRTRTAKALTALENEELPLPAGWEKSER